MVGVLVSTCFFQSVYFNLFISICLFQSVYFNLLISICLCQSVYVNLYIFSKVTLHRSHFHVVEPQIKRAIKSKWTMTLILNEFAEKWTLIFPALCFNWIFFKWKLIFKTTRTFQGLIHSPLVDHFLSSHKHHLWMEKVELIFSSHQDQTNSGLNDTLKLLTFNPGALTSCPFYLAANALLLQRFFLDNKGLCNLFILNHFQLSTYERNWYKQRYKHRVMHLHLPYFIRCLSTIIYIINWLH